MKGLACLGILLILFPAFGRGVATTDNGVLVVDIFNNYGCGYYTNYRHVCRAPVFLLDEMYPDRTFPVVIQDRGGPADEQRTHWQLVPAPAGDNKFFVRMCGVCSHGPCCFYWKLKKHFAWSELLAVENTDDKAEKKTMFHIQPSKGGYVINGCNDYGKCRYEMTWDKWNAKPHLKYVYCHHYKNQGVKWRVTIQASGSKAEMRIPFSGRRRIWHQRKAKDGIMVVKFKNLYGCRTTGYYKPLCNTDMFFLDEMNRDGTFPVVIQDRGGPEDAARNKWELVSAGGENRFYVRMCGVCSHGPCCFYWKLRRHFTYSEVVAMENPDDGVDKKDMFHIKAERGRYVINACNDFGRCRYELTWATWRNRGHVKWIYVHHYRNEGVRWRVVLQPSWKG